MAGDRLAEKGSGEGREGYGGVGRGNGSGEVSGREGRGGGGEG